MSSYEPKEAFPYTPPSNEILEKYAHIFEIKDELPINFFKNIFTMKSSPMSGIKSRMALLSSVRVSVARRIQFIIEN